MKNTLLKFIAAMVLLVSFSPQAWAVWLTGYVSSGGSNPNGRIYYGIGNGGYASIIGPSGNYDSPWMASANVPYQPAGDIVIPDSITHNGVKYPVTMISERAFKKCTSITSVTIPAGVTTVYSYAFDHCEGMISINIPSTVTSIGTYAFRGCYSLTSISIPDGVTQIQTETFTGDSSLISVNIGNGVTHIGNYAFEGCTNLNSIIWGSSIASIGEMSFARCKGLTSITIPSTITSIGSRPFVLCTGLTSIIVESGNTVYDSRDNCNALIETATNKLIAGCRNTIIPNTVTEIDFEAFDSQPLTSITIPESVITIGSYAFENCSSLQSVEIGSSVTNIYNGCFEGCSGLSSITIPSAVTSIYWDAFKGCTGLTTVVFNATNCTTMCGTSNSPQTHLAFSGCPNLRTVIIGSNVTNIPSYAFYNITSLDTVWMLPSTPPTIGTYAFVNNANGRVFMMTGCSYSNYYTNYSGNYWYTHRDYLRDPIIDINVDVTSSNTTRGTVSILQQRNHNVRCDSTAVIQATAATGYHFGKWSNGKLSSPDTLHLTGDTSVTAYFYSFAVATSDNSRGTVTHTKLANRQEKVQATANTGYHFGHWTGGGTANPYTVILSSDTVVTAYFYKLDVFVDNSTHGTVSHTKLANCKERIQATARYGYHFDRWSNGRTANPDTIILSGDSTVTAIFEPNRYSISGNSNNYLRGSVMIAGTGISSTEVPYLDTVALVAVPNYGYHFTYWSYTTDDGNTSTRYGNDTLELCANRDKTATAYFDYNQYRVTAGVDTSIHGSVSGGGWYNYQSICTITANANYGYHFTHWSDGVTVNPRTITVTRDTSFTAYYAPNQYTLTIVNGEPSFGTVGIEGSNTLTKTVNYGDTISHFGIANTHYHNRYIHIETSGYNSWNKYDHNGRDTSSWYSVMNADYTITYHFAIDTHTVTVAANDNLRGMVESTGTRFTYGSPCILTATAFAGYTFHGWSNGVTDNPYAFAVQEDVNLTAIFLAPGEEMYSIMVTSANPSMGTVSGGGNYNAGETARLTATPNTGYRFVRWQDNNTQNPRNVVVTRDSSFTAYFEALDGIEDVDGYGVGVYAENGHIVIEGAEGLNVQVYDMMGRLAGTNNNSSTATFTVPTSGVYIVKVAGFPARKIVVVR
ncbi:MAG: leucine-rich repeat protein [Bacteroidales bacterium]|nr:leucine-rich repeat protein [Bacteroidales bacterium]